MKTFIVLILLVGSILARPFTLPPEGLYVSIRNDAIQQFASQISLSIGDTANTYTSTPDYSGSTSDVDFTFSSFAYDINLEGFTFFPGSTPPAINIGWNSFDFIIQFNFHICAHAWPNPCDDGYIQVYTTNVVKLQVDAQLVLSNPTVSFQTTGVSLTFNSGDVQVYVSCTSTLCLIPVDDIADAVAQNFVPTFQTEMVNIINSAAQSYINTIATSFKVPSLNLLLELEGGFALYPPNSATPNVVLFAQGLFEPGNGGSQKPPFSPTVSPPDSVFTSPKGQLDLIFTNYMLRTAIWALDLQNYFNRTITDKDLPSNSPVHLKTSDHIFLLAVPSLAAYPNMDINVQISLYNVSEVDLGSQGGLVANTIQADFYLVNSTLNKYGWTLLFDISLDVGLATSMTGSSITLTSKLSNWDVSTTVVKSAIGAITASLFTDALELGLSLDAPVPPPFSFAVPSEFSVSSPSITFGTEYADVSANIAYVVPVPNESCGNGAHYCPVQNTCCQWSAGWGCCTLPDANCCDGSGCCANGWDCDGDECVSNLKTENGTQTVRYNRFKGSVPVF